MRNNIQEMLELSKTFFFFFLNKFSVKFLNYLIFKIKSVGKGNRQKLLWGDYGVSLLLLLLILLALALAKWRVDWLGDLTDLVVPGHLFFFLPPFFFLLPITLNDMTTFSITVSALRLFCRKILWNYTCFKHMLLCGAEYGEANCCDWFP